MHFGIEVPSFVVEWHNQEFITMELSVGTARFGILSILIRIFLGKYLSTSVLLLSMQPLMKQINLSCIFLSNDNILNSSFCYSSEFKYYC